MIKFPSLNDQEVEIQCPKARSLLRPNCPNSSMLDHFHQPNKREGVAADDLESQPVDLCRHQCLSWPDATAGVFCAIRARRGPGCWFSTSPSGSLRMSRGKPTRRERQGGEPPVLHGKRGTRLATGALGATIHWQSQWHPTGCFILGDWRRENPTTIFTVKTNLCKKQSKRRIR